MPIEQKPVTIKICGKCGQDYQGEPVISQKDHKTELCSQCGSDEAIADFEAFMSSLKPGDIVEYLRPGWPKKVRCGRIEP